MDLDLKGDMLSFQPVAEDLQILPPFVFPCPLPETESLPPLFLDAREYGSLSRFVRSCCKVSNKSNAQLVTVICKTSNEIEDIKKLNHDSSIVSNVVPEIDSNSHTDFLNQRLRLCIFATRPIHFGEEIILNSTNKYLNFPCSCNHPNCKVIEAISRIHIAMEDLEERNEFSLLLEKRDDARRAVLEKNERVELNQVFSF